MDTAQIIAQKDAQIEALQLKIYDLVHQIGKLERIIYGRKSERHVPEQGPNLFSHLEDGNSTPVVEPISETEKITYERKKKSNHKGRTLLQGCSHLPVEELLLDVVDKTDLLKIGELVSEKLAYKPGRLFIKRIVRPKYKHTETEEIKIAEPINEPIPKCEADVSLLAYTVTSKFIDHLPEYRMLQIFKREGVDIPASTMNSWTHQIARLVKPVAETIIAEILSSGYVQADESTIKVMAGKKNSTHTGWMWVLSSPENKNVGFKYNESRSKQVAANLFVDYKGIIQSDGLASYDDLEKNNPDILHVNCWAHARRMFEQALTNDKAKATYALDSIRDYYMIERKCSNNDFTYAERQHERALLSEKIASFKQWLDKESLLVPPKSPIGKAISYTLNRWKKLTRYLENGIIEIDNNLIENAIRPLALGRKNYLFAGSHEAATNISYFYTLFGTCKKLEVNPYNYMLWLLERINNTNIQHLTTLTPRAYKNSLDMVEV